MKRAFAILFALMLFLSGCAQAPVESPAYGNEKLWAVDIAQEGYGRTGASHMVDRQGEDIRLTLTIAPAAFKQTPASEMEIVRVGGREYRIKDSTICWDGADENGKWIGGTQYSRTMSWEHDGYVYYVFAETFKESVSLAVASPETAGKLENDPLAELAGFELKSDIWWVEFRKENITVNITLHMPVFEEAALREYIKDGKFKRIEEGGTEYFLCKNERKPDDPNSAAMLWRTDKGLLYLNANVPWAYRNDLPDEALGFINPELLKSITEQMGGKTMPFDGSLRTSGS